MSVYVRADGSVVPCSLWEDALGIFGNIKTSSIEKIWHSIAMFMENVKNFINLNCGNCILFKEGLCSFWNICIVRGCYYGRWRSSDFVEES
jgi:radical SAM protein with 4Fe4S-binding SPASM domain